MPKFSKFINLAKRVLDEGGIPSREQDRRQPQRRDHGRRAPQAQYGVGQGRSHDAHRAPAAGGDRQAVARYAYLLRTAPPEQLEQLHREAFATLTPAQREELLAQLAQAEPVYGSARSSDPRDLAVAATRVESARPGALQRILGGAGRGGRGGVGRKVALGGAGLAAGGLLVAVAGGAVLSGIGGSLLQGAESMGVDFGAMAEGLDPAAFGLDSLEALDLGGLSEGVAGVGEQVNGWGEQIGQAASEFRLPGLGDLFGK